MRRLNRFLALGLAGVITLLAGLSWDALAHAGDPLLAGHERIFTLANPAHVALATGIGGVVVGVLGAVDASLRASITTTSSLLGRRRRAALGAAAAPVAGLLAVTGWAMTRPQPSPAAIVAPAADPVSADHHTPDAGGDADAGTATAQERAEAEALITATKLALASAGYEDAAVAEAAGYRPVQPPTSRLVHYVNVAHLVDPGVLDPAAPESLVYRSTPEGPVLEGAMYILPSVESPVPDVGGLSDHWHGHDDLCFSTSTAMIVGTVRADGACPPGARNEATPPMLHVWIVDRPGGPFAGL